MSPRRYLAGFAKVAWTKLEIDESFKNILHCVPTLRGHRKIKFVSRTGKNMTLITSASWGGDEIFVSGAGPRYIKGC